MRKFMLLFAFLGLIGMQSFAQQVTGTVTSAEDGSTLPGVSVVVKGTTNGTVTDIDGKYSLNASEGSTLVFSFVGMKTTEVPVSGSVVNVSMETEDVGLDEVVVTALGISRDKKSLGYAVQEIGGESVSDVKETNFVSSLSGKVAGVSIKMPNTMGGSANVVIRGNSSLLGNNQALFVVDGVPFDNSNNSNNSGGWGGYDYGNNAMDINPDDIESISVLRGAAATSLYGSRASNGVILITTKKGKKRKGIGVTVNSGIMISKIDLATAPKIQYEYGGGYGPYYGGGRNGNFFEEDLDGDGVMEVIVPTSEDASWGEKFDPDYQVVHWTHLDPNQSDYLATRPWVGAKNGYTSFFETGIKYNNSIAFDGGNEHGTFRFSYTNLDEKGLLPNSSVKKNVFNLSGSYNLSDKLKVEAAANYIVNEVVGRFGTGYDGANPMQAMAQWFQSNVDFDNLKEYVSPEGLHRTWNYAYVDPSSLYPIYADNPYWTRYKNFQNDGRNRFFGYGKLSYDLFEGMTLEGRVATDFYSEYYEQRTAVGSNALSDYTNYQRDFKEVNAEVYAKYQKTIGDLSLNGFLAASIRRQEIYSIWVSTVGGLIIPEFYSVTNSKASLFPDENMIEKGVNSFYGNFSVGYKNFVYLDVSGRQDKSSSLPEDNNTYFYPAVSGSLILSELPGLKDMSFLSFAKLRANWAKVGSDAPVYSVNPGYNQNLNFGGLGLFSMPTTLNNKDLRPEISTSIETGLEARFFNNRFGFDIAVYKTNVVDQIIPATVSTASGYSRKYVNVGELENKGLEVSLNANPIKTKDFSWNMVVNWYANRNMVVDLGEIDNILYYSAWDVSVNATEGEPAGAIKGTNFVYTDGKKTVISDGSYKGYYKITEDEEVIGNINPDWNMGVTNSFSYKNISMSFLIDIQKGGDIYSVNTKYGLGTGLYDETVGNNDKGNPKRDPVADGGGYRYPNTVYEDGTPNETYIRGSHWGGWSYYNRLPTAEYVFDASYVKLRELILSYSLPQKMINRTPFNTIAVSAVARNLWIIHKNTRHFDPEASLSAGNNQGIETGSYPTARTFGFNLKLVF